MLQLRKLMLVFIILFALSAKIQDVTFFRISGASLAVEHRFALFKETITASVTQHVSLLNKFLIILRRAAVMRDLYSVELVQVVLVLAVALFAETEIVTGYAVKAEIATVNGFLTAIASKPSVKVLDLFFYELFDLCLERLSYLTFILFGVIL